MSFPTLANLTKKKIIEYAVNGSLKPTVCLDPVTSNKLFQQLLPLLEMLDENALEVIGKTIKPTVINMIGIHMTEKIFEVIRSFNLTSLSLGYFELLTSFEKDRKFHSLSKKYPPLEPSRRYGRDETGEDEYRKEIGTVFDLPAVLRRLINQESRSSLTNLDLSPVSMGTREGHTEQFADGWAKEIGRMFPSLKTLSLRHRITTCKDFQDICSLFPNLEILDLSNTSIESLTGISLLKNLKTLRIGSLQFEKSRCLMDIFEIENLENLSFAEPISADSDGTIEAYLRSRRSFPKLRHLDLSYTFCKKENIRKLVEAHPTLESLSICYTDPLEFPGIRGFDSDSVQAATKALKFYTAENNAPMVGAVLLNICEVICTRGQPPAEHMRECFKQVVSTLESFYFLKRVKKYGSGCCDILLTIAPLNTYNQDDLVRLVNFMITYISPRVKLFDSHFIANKATEPQWDVLNSRELLLNTPHIDLNQICRLCISMLEKAIDQWESLEFSNYLIIFDYIKDRVNLNLEMFQSVQKQRIMDRLSRTRDELHSQGFREDVDAAERLIQFIDINF
ncbi:hypothetical protein B9Z55_007554 [Caenorhabditis nigoni]|uniref:Uncharacterized protein n=1 Tax=Caenorhabditis nigoni TaxID=1611254 RepID=A0A2G5VAS1_9PELO|nr:hypothetical protein B9Z55_007554 [Caenorhabditis nigoni]